MVLTVLGNWAIDRRSYLSDRKATARSCPLHGSMGHRPLVFYRDLQRPGRWGPTQGA